MTPTNQGGDAVKMSGGADKPAWQTRRPCPLLSIDNKQNVLYITTWFYMLQMLYVTITTWFYMLQLALNPVNLKIELSYINYKIISCRGPHLKPKLTSVVRLMLPYL